MTFLFPEFDRRTMLTGAAGAAAGIAGLAMGHDAHAGAHATPALDMENPADNLTALLKLRADTSGADVVSAFPGECWAMIPGVGNYKLFKTFGIGASHIEEVDEGWRIFHREVFYYLDADTGEVLEEWENPFLGRKVEVFHVANDPVNGTFKREGEGVLAAPYPYVLNGDDLIFQWNFYIFHEADLKLEEYPLQSAGNVDQHAELWGIQGKMSDVVKPDVSSAPSTTSWTRVAQWIPFMEMGNRPGTIVNHSHAFKMLNGFAPIPKHILDYTEKNYPEYLESPKEWVSPQFNESSYSNYKEYLDGKKTDQEEG